jgi:hypothetical protein
MADEIRLEDIKSKEDALVLIVKLLEKADKGDKRAEKLAELLYKIYVESEYFGGK